MSISVVPGGVKLDNGAGSGLLDEAERPHIHIKPSKGGWTLDLGLLWSYRSVVFLLIWRDFKVKYKQSAFGAFWIILHPFCSVILYSFLFGKLAKMPSDNVPYFLFNYVAMAPWMLFASSLAAVSQSLIANAQLIQKVYFPRVLLPIHGMLSCLPDFLILFGIQIILLSVVGFVPTIKIFWLPLLLLWMLLIALGVGMFVAALMVRYRDVSTILSFVIQLWFYATPVVYSSDVLKQYSPWLQSLAACNPMSWVVNAFRWAILNTSTSPEPFMIVPILATLVVLTVGYWFFNNCEKSLADVI
jgi:lipopolysaccharide transport system permease protein